MNIKDAINILNISGELTKDMIKLAYKKACNKYHPDKGGSTEMMQAVNEAYTTLKTYDGELNIEEEELNNYPDELNNVINELLTLTEIIIEICGVWVWVTGNTKPHSKILGKNGLGFFWASKKKAWYFRPADWKSSNRGTWSMDEIRGSHGSNFIPIKKPRMLKAG